MSSRFIHTDVPKVDPAAGALRAALSAWNHPPVYRSTDEEPRKPVFVTVSRQPGAGGLSFSHKLAERLRTEGADDWSAWDRELVEKVSTEHGIAKDIIEMIPNRRHDWLEELLQSFTVSKDPPDVTEIRAYKRVAVTIRALAQAGHAIIVGLGGTFITERMPGAIHLRLIAPKENRIQRTAEWEKISLHHAAERIEEIDKRRTDFYRRYWPGKSVSPETFTMTLNGGELSADEMVEAVLPLIHLREGCCAIAPTRSAERKAGGAL